MDNKAPTQPGRPSGAESRDDRLKAALKANIARRKAQARKRQAAAVDNKSDTSEA